MGDRRLTRVLLVLGVVCLLVGGLWTLQGAGIVPGSFMTGSRFWLGAGIALDLAGLYLLYRGVARQPRSQ